MAKQIPTATEPSIDELARKWTQAKDLATLLEPTTTYFPSLYPPPFATAAEVEELRRLADAYDQAQEARGDKRRAHRGSPEWWTRPTPAPAPTPPKVRAWTDAYQVGQEVLYLDRARAPARVVAIIPAQADLSAAQPSIWQAMQRQRRHDRPVDPVRQIARIVVALAPVPGGEAILHVVARASALEVVS